MALRVGEKVWMMERWQGVHMMYYKPYTCYAEASRAAAKIRSVAKKGGLKVVKVKGEKDTWDITPSSGFDTTTVMLTWHVVLA